MTEQKKNLTKAQRQAQNDKKVSHIMTWIIVILIALGLAFAIYSFSL